MKILTRISFVLILLMAVNSLTANAQSTENQQVDKKELKLAKKIEKAKTNLAKSKSKLSKLEEEQSKKTIKFEKQNAKGNLSPNDVTKIKKSLENLAKKIEKEEAKIESLEEFLQENDSEDSTPPNSTLE
ncbi:MAG: hypothetical protein LPK25_07070 [Cyclobacteriaceae bacterium]|nr:hypothetical protein [Cyclobacteriaceae bacterium]MDX5466454.1 hypothetical protein [Cyclobacteriaceae bacterium]